MPSYTGTDAADTLAGSAGADTLTGLSGDDLYLVNHLDDQVVESLAAGFDTIETSVLDALGRFDISALVAVEGLRFTQNLNAVLIGNAADNRIEVSALFSTSDTLIGGAGNDSLFSQGGADRLDGGIGDDWLDGGTGADITIGGQGNDTHVIGQTTDRVIELADGGTDAIRSAVMTDLSLAWAQNVETLIYTGTSAAQIKGNDLDNSLTGKANADTLLGGAGNDRLTGAGGADSLVGGTGDDLYFADALDTITELAGEGIDGVVGSRSDLSAAGLAGLVENLFYTGGGAATLVGNALANVIAGGIGNDSLTGGDGNDSLAGGNGADQVLGEAGDDVLTGGAITGYGWGAALTDSAADTLMGGAGSDRYLIFDLRDLVSDTGAGPGEVDAIIAACDESLARHTGVEALILADGSAARLGLGSALGDVIIGSSGENSLSGLAGHDLIAAWGWAAGAAAAQDILDGGDGNDTLVALDLATAAQGGAAVLSGGLGNDLYLLGREGLAVGGIDTSGTDTAVLFRSADLSQLSGVERIVLFGAKEGLLAGELAALAEARLALDRLAGILTIGADHEGGIAPNQDARGNEAANRILGNSAANVLRGEAGNDTIFGGAGSDVLEGGAGADSLLGGRGDDRYEVDAADSVVEAADGGFDILRSFDIAALSLRANVEGYVYLGTQSVLLAGSNLTPAPDHLAAGTGNDTLRGYQGNDSLWGNAGNDLLEGGDHDDSLSGGAGDDSLTGGQGDDRLEGGTSNDALYGGANWDWLSGGAGADLLSGAEGNDTLLGGAGNDTLLGEGEHDVLYGGAGRDQLFAGDQAAAAGGSGDIMFGDSPDGSTLAAADLFGILSVGAVNGATETFTGSGVFQWAKAATIADFDLGLDRIGLTAGFVGNQDSVIDGASEAAAGGDFSATDELIFFRSPISADLVADPATGFLPLEATLATSGIGNASAAIAVNETRIFVLSDGESAAVFLFQSADGNASVSTDEMYLLAVVAGQPVLGASDFSLLVV